MPDLFVKEPVPIAEMVAEAERELKMRKEVYPRRVRNGSMSWQKCERQIRVQEAIIAQLRMLGDTR